MLNARFVSTGADEALLKAMYSDENREYDYEELEKAMDRSKLVQKEVQYKTKTGKVATRKQWVRAGEDKKPDKPATSTGNAQSDSNGDSTFKEGQTVTWSEDGKERICKIQRVRQTQTGKQYLRVRTDDGRVMDVPAHLCKPYTKAQDDTTSNSKSTKPSGNKFNSAMEEAKKSGSTKELEEAIKDGSIKTISTKSGTYTHDPSRGVYVNAKGTSEFSYKKMASKLKRRAISGQAVKVEGGSASTKAQDDAKKSSSDSKTGKNSDNGSKEPSYTLDSLGKMKKGSIVTRKASDGYYVYQKQDSDPTGYGTWSCKHINNSGTIQILGSRTTKKLANMSGFVATPKAVTDNMDGIHNTFLGVNPNVVDKDDSAPKPEKSLGVVKSKRYKTDFTHQTLPTSGYKTGDMVCLYNREDDSLYVYQKQGHGDWTTRYISPDGKATGYSGKEDSNLMRNIRSANSGNDKFMGVKPTGNLETAIKQNAHNVSLSANPNIIGGTAKSSKPKYTPKDKPKNGNKAGEKLSNELLDSLKDVKRSSFHLDKSKSTIEKLLNSAKIGTVVTYEDEFETRTYTKITDTSWEEVSKRDGFKDWHNYTITRYMSSGLADYYDNSRKTRSLTATVPSKAKEKSKTPYLDDSDRKLLKDGNTLTFLWVLHRNDSEMFKDAGFTEESLHNRDYNHIDYDKDSGIYTVRMKNGDKHFFDSNYKYRGMKQY